MHRQCAQVAQRSVADIGAQLEGRSHPPHPAVDGVRALITFADTDDEGDRFVDAPSELAREHADRAPLDTGELLPMSLLPRCGWWLADGYLETASP